MMTTIAHNHLAGEPCNALTCPVAWHTSHPNAAPIREAWPIMSHHAARARELMLETAAASRYIGIYETGGTCPECGETVADLSEATVVSHALLCEPIQSVRAIRAAFGMRG